jgi:glycosyltransferase involved in cell wall biosynthesis
MKIAQLVSSFPPYTGGMGNVVKENVSRLSHKHEVHIFTPSYNDSKEVEGKEKKYQVHRINPSLRVSKLPLIDNTEVLFNIKNKLANSFDLVHLHYPFFGTDTLVANWRKKFSTPLVITYHMDPIARGLKGVIFLVYKKLFQKKVLAQADKIIASSFDYINHSSAKSFFKDNKEKFIELPFGVDTTHFKPKSFKDNELSCNSFQAENNILFVGGMDQPHYFKGIPLLLKAANKLKDKLDFNLFLIGSGKLQEKYQLQASKLGLEDKVQFVGYVTGDKLIDWYNFADLTVLPSINKSEAFGLVLVESMACGTPVLAANLPGVRQVANKAGFTFESQNYQDLAEKLVTFFEDENCKVLSEQTREAVINKFNWSKRVNKLEQIYQSLS